MIKPEIQIGFLAFMRYIEIVCSATASFFTVSHLPITITSNARNTMTPANTSAAL